jgi:hypothetical protein
VEQAVLTLEVEVEVVLTKVEYGPVAVVVPV